jgi:hypothetical protein
MKYEHLLIIAATTFGAGCLDTDDADVAEPVPEELASLPDEAADVYELEVAEAAHAPTCGDGSVTFHEWQCVNYWQNGWKWEWRIVTVGAQTWNCVEPYLESTWGRTTTWKNLTMTACGGGPDDLCMGERNPRPRPIAPCPNIQPPLP